MILNKPKICSVIPTGRKHTTILDQSMNRSSDLHCINSMVGSTIQTAAILGHHILKVSQFQHDRPEKREKKKHQSHTPAEKGRSAAGHTVALTCCSTTSLTRCPRPLSRWSASHPGLRREPMVHRFLHLPGPVARLGVFAVHDPSLEGPSQEAGKIVERRRR